MKRCVFLLFVAAGLFLSLFTYAQCDDCPEAPEGFQTDFCFTDSIFVGECALFSAEADYFWMRQKKNKLVKVPIPEEVDNAFLVSLTQNREYRKLSPAQFLFIREALLTWETEKLRIGYTMENSGLGIKIVEEGTGKLPEKGKKVTVHYTGKLSDGTQFDSSIERGRPFSFVLGQGRVIKGWDEGIAKLKVGSKAWLMIPPELGYGKRGAGGTIPPNATLFFYVEVLDSGK